MRVVLDTNSIVSCYLTPQGRFARILDLWEQDAFDLLVSEVILTEYSQVLTYPRLRSVHRLTDARHVEISSALRAFAEFLVPETLGGSWAGVAQTVSSR